MKLYRRTDCEIFSFEKVARIFHFIFCSKKKKDVIYLESFITVAFISFAKSLKQNNSPIALDSDNSDLDDPIGKTKDLISLKVVKLVIRVNRYFYIFGNIDAGKYRLLNIRAYWKDINYKYVESTHTRKIINV